MTTIWKYSLQSSCSFEMCSFEMPRGASILTVQTQNNAPQLWALVNPNASTERRHFMVFGTGHDMPTAELTLQYIATFQLDGGALVFHVFEVEGVVS